MRCLTASGSLATFKPHTDASPDVGASSPVSILTVVDLPAPLGPRKAQIVPLATSSVRWSTAVKPPKRRVRSRHEIMASEAESQAKLDPAGVKSGRKSQRLARRTVVAAL